MKHCGATEMLQPTNHTLQIYESWFVWYWPKQKAHHPRFSIFSWKWSMKWESPPKSWVISHSPVKGYNVGCLLTVSVSMFQFVTVTVCVLHWHFYKTCHISFTCLWPHFHCSGGDGRRLWGGATPVMFMATCMGVTSGAFSHPNQDVLVPEPNQHTSTMWSQDKTEPNLTEPNLIYVLLFSDRSVRL